MFLQNDVKQIEKKNYTNFAFQKKMQSKDDATDKFIYLITKNISSSFLQAKDPETPPTIHAKFCPEVWEWHVVILHSTYIVL